MAAQSDGEPATQDTPMGKISICSITDQSTQRVLEGEGFGKPTRSCRGLSPDLPTTAAPRFLSPLTAGGSPPAAFCRRRGTVALRPQTGPHTLAAAPCRARTHSHVCQHPQPIRHWTTGTGWCSEMEGEETLRNPNEIAKLSLGLRSAPNPPTSEESDKTYQLLKRDPSGSFQGLSTSSLWKPIQ